MREPKEITIDEITYKMYPLSPFKSSKILTRILKLVGRPLGKLIGESQKGGKGGLMDADVNPEIIGLALEALTERMEESEIEKLMKDLLPLDLITFSEEGGEKFTKIINIENHLNKRDKGLMHLFKLVKFSLEVNYSDFLGEIAELKG